jgi:glycosyltransferase involved in cell wall biosynthesis
MLEVVMCTYNGEKYIEEQILSILNQTVTVDLISIYDDQSSDNTLSIIHEIKDKTSININVTVNKKNKGYIKNFYEGIVECSSLSKLVFLCDQDDIWHPEKVVKFILESKQLIGPSLLFSDAMLVDDDNVSLNLSLWKSIGFNINEEKEELYKRNVITGATACINRELVNLIKDTDFPLNIPHDYSIAALANAFGNIVPINKLLINYRQHSNNQIGTSLNFFAKIKKALINNDKNYFYLEAIRSDTLATLVKKNEVQSQKFKRRACYYYYINQSSAFTLLPYLLDNRDKVYSWKSIVKIMYIKLLCNNKK